MPNTDSLRLALRLNAGFSTLSAFALFVAHGEIGKMMGVDPRLLIGVGVGLAAFAGYLVYTAARSDISKLRTEALQHSCADFAWVAASIGVIASGRLTPLGNGMLVAIGAPVLALGIAQLRSLPPKNEGTKMTNA
jgi:hypothetical protein